MCGLCGTLLTNKLVYRDDVNVTVHRDKFLVIKPTRCTDFSNLFLEWNSTCFGQFLCPSSGVFHYKQSNGICHTGLLTACEQDQDGTACPKHVEFHSKNKFEKLMHLVAYIIRNNVWNMEHIKILYSRV